MFCKVGIVFHQASRHQFFIGAKFVPWFNAFRTRCEFRIFRHNAGFLLFFKRLLTKPIPTFVELSFVASGKALGNLMRSMSRSICNVSEKRAVGCACLLFADPCDRLIGQIFGQVIAFFGFPGGVYARRSVKQNGCKVVHLAAYEAVELLKAASGWPAIEWSRNAQLPRGSLVALAEIAGVEAVQFQNLPNVGAGVRNHARCARPRCSELSNGAHVYRVVISSREQSRTCR